MDGQAIKNIGQYAQEALRAEYTIIDVEGVPYTTQALRPVVPKEEAPDTIVMHTLGALAEFVRTSYPLDDQPIVHVDGPGLVKVLSAVRGAARQRFLVASAVLPGRVDPLACVGSFRPVEQVVIELLHRTLPNDDRTALLQFIGAVRNEEEVKVLDDGVSQLVSLKAGVHGLAERTAPLTVRLAPFRTFAEVEQPESTYVLRMKKGQDQPLVGLFEADGGAWELVAIQRIRAHLAGLLEGTAVTLLA